MEAYSAAVGSWMARELTEDRGDLLTPLAPLPLPVTGPLMVPFPLPFPLTPWEKKRQRNTQVFVIPEMSNYCHKSKNTESDAKHPERDPVNAIATAQMQLQHVRPTYTS